MTLLGNNLTVVLSLAVLETVLNPTQTNELINANFYAKCVAIKLSSS